MVVAHRGAAWDEPEHTKPAYLAALQQGARAFECDVRMTVDRELVCFHDRKIDRTSSASGVVSELSLPQLRKIDFGSWKNGDPADILTLTELLDIAASADESVDLFIETKHPTRYGNDVEHKLAQILQARNLTTGGPGKPQVNVMSFSLKAMRLVKSVLPHVRTVLLLDNLLPPSCVNGKMPSGIDLPGISTGILRRYPTFVAHQHEAGRPVSVWTVDREDDLQRCLVRGVDFITTNRPAWALAQIKAWLLEQSETE